MIEYLGKSWMEQCALVGPPGHDAATMGRGPTRRWWVLGALGLVLFHCEARTAMPSPEPSPRKLRILCLHGYHGSAQILRSQLGPLASSLEPLVELVYVDAPSLAAGDFGWWHAVAKESDPSRDDPGVT